MLALRTGGTQPGVPSPTPVISYRPWLSREKEKSQILTVLLWSFATSKFDDFRSR